MEDHVAVARVVDIGQLAERHAQPVGVLQQQGAHGLRVAAAPGVQDHHHVRRLVRAVRLGDDAALVGGLHRVHHVDGPEAELREALGAQAHGRAGRAGRRLHHHVGGAGDGGEDTRHLARRGVEHVEVVAEDVHHHRRDLARDRLADAVAEEGQHRRLETGEARQHRPDLIGRAFLRPGTDGFELDVELAAVRAPGVLALLGAPDLLRDRGDRGQAEQFLGDGGPEPMHLFERRARRRRDLQDEVPLTELRQELPAEEGEHGQRGAAQQRDGGDHAPRLRRHTCQPAAVARLDPALEPRLGVGPHAPREDRQREGGSHRERHGRETRGSRGRRRARAGRRSSPAGPSA